MTAVTTDLTFDLEVDFEVRDEELEPLEVMDVEQDGSEITITVTTGNITAEKLENDYVTSVYDSEGTELRVASLEVNNLHESITVHLDGVYMEKPDRSDLAVKFPNGERVAVRDCEVSGSFITITLEEPIKKDDLVSKKEIREQLIRQFAISLDALLADGDSPQSSDLTASETKEQ